MAFNVNKSKKLPAVPGTKPSTHNAQLLVSTGIPSLDQVIGGGLPIGSILLIEEDTYGNYANIMLKYFIAEGIAVSHNSFIASRDTKPSQILSQLPEVATLSRFCDNTSPEGELRIAWRYKNLKLEDTGSTRNENFGHHFDLTKNMDNEKIKRTEVTLWDGENVKWKTEAFENQEYVDLLKSVEDTLSKGKYLVSDSPEQRNILRISIQSLGSRLWMCEKEEDTKNDLLRFLYCLRVLLRTSFAVLTITFPAHFYDNKDALVERLEHLADTVVELESFAGSKKETNPVFKGYHGLLHVKKLSAFNTLAPHCPHSIDLAFKLRHTKFLIEVLHIPPELGETTEREQDDIACGSGRLGKSVLDF